MSRGSSYFAFRAGALAGIIALGFSFIIRLGGLAPFAPETAIEAFIGIIPASLEQPMIQAFGDSAGLLGLAMASIFAVIVYGIFGILFDKFYLPWIGRFHSMSQTEQFLSFSIVPWLFFGVLVFPLSGASFFGLNATVFSQYAVFLFPLVLLMSQLVFALIMTSSYKAAGFFEASNLPSRSIMAGTRLPVGSSVSRERRTFIERSVIIVIGGVLALSSIGIVASEAIASAGTGGARSGMSYELSAANPIFEDPRLASLVDSEITSNRNFYRVAIDLFDPSVNPNTWSLQVLGQGNSKSYSLDNLKSLPSIAEYVTFECVSNLVNGNLISNALWNGIKISDLLADANIPTSGAQYVVFTSVDGYTVGIPISKALESDTIVAYQMNGVDLPQEHGYPLRAVIPGLYGMMSAKWVTKIQIVDSFYNGYWQTRGYTAAAQINTLAFIIIPGDGSQVSLSQNGGSVLMGGYAFAGERGIAKVELSFDQGNTWQQVILKNPISNVTWTLWALEWRPSQAGRYQVYARATDGLGQVQTSAQTPPYPNGATGYAMISVVVNN